MQFRLPPELQKELLEYDPAFKTLVKQQTTSVNTKNRKVTHPLGKPIQLIPTDVVRESMYNDAIDNINTMQASDRHRLFTRIKDGDVKPCAILYHYEQVWYAAWLPPQGKEDQYIYGYSYAFKDNATAVKMLPSQIRNKLNFHSDESKQLEEYQVGRVRYYAYSKLVTKQDIIDGHDFKNWNIPCTLSYHKKSAVLYTHIRSFEEELYSKIPVWTDSRRVFDRITTTLPAFVVFNNDYRFGNTCCNYWKEHDIRKANVSYELILSLIKYYAHGNDYEGDNFRKLNKVFHIIDTPFFRKWIQSQCDEVNKNFYDSTNKLVKTIRAPWIRIFVLFETITHIQDIWPTCPIDYYQSHIQQLLSIRSSRWGTLQTQAWLNEHMPVASFFSILEKEYDRNINDTRTRFNYDEDLQLPRFYYSNWTDTLSMLDTVLAYNECATEPLTLDVPKRWRLSEFHDHVQSVAWKVKNKNEDLPQDLFPEPIKIQLGHSKWTFFQPVDTHQLAAWGQAVRNCVGSSSHYAESCKKKKHFIVLCMIDNKPQFTIQLVVVMGMMSVKQIAGISNTSLTPEQNQLYTTAFSKALATRQTALTSN